MSVQLKLNDLPQSTVKASVLKSQCVRGVCLAQLEEQAILDLRVMSLSPTLGVEITLK